MPELILQLKAVKSERGLSNQDILELLQAKGYYTSLSTIKRVFADSSEDIAFRYEESIQPIEDVLLVEAAPVPVEELESIEDAQQYVSQIEGLQAAVLLKDNLIEELSRNNTALQTTVEEQSATIQKQAETIAKLKKKLSQVQTKLALVVAAFIILTILVFTYLIIHDVPNPDYGIFRFKAFMEESAAIINGSHAAAFVDQIAQCVKL